MKRILLATLVFFYAYLSFAQLGANGYYRIQNYGSERYLYVYDDKGSVHVGTTSADLGALQLWNGFAKASCDPATVVYITNVGENHYKFNSQGCDSHSIVGYDLKITDNSYRVKDTYKAGASKSGVQSFLADGEASKFFDEGIVTTNTTEANFRYWKVHPVTANSEYYFGIKADIASEGSFYAPFFAEFPFTFSSKGMAAYYISKVDKGLAVIAEVKDNVVPGATPVLIKCAAKNPSSNRLNIARNNAPGLKSNQLGGVYFCTTNTARHKHTTDYNPQTMRLLSVDADGKLVFVKSDVKYVPANKAYLKVPAGTPDIVRVVTQKEYDNIVSGIDEVGADSGLSQKVYTTSGVCVGEGETVLRQLPSGVYIKSGKKFLVK